MASPLQLAEAYNFPGNERLTLKFSRHSPPFDNDVLILQHK